MKNAKKLIAKIQRQKIVPVPRWHYVAKNIAFWGLLVVSILLGGIALSMILFIIIQVDPLMMHHILMTDARFFVEALPVFWLATLAILLGLAIIGARHTKKGYRYSLITIFSLSLFLNVALGAGIYSFGGAEELEEIVQKNVMFYHGAEKRKKEVWSNPHLGFLAGEIIQLNDDEILIIRDFEDQDWLVNIEEVPHLPSFLVVEVGEKFKFIGEYDPAEDSFTAVGMRPWHMGMREMMNLPAPPKGSFRGSKMGR